ncbi:hypothetical protein VB716_14015 [Synechococcus sp. CCY9201]|jgi:uncharacterized protein HemX|uniref:hypothetical protein n=1 Tax=unclassified Synechococcus TaxID=2626047 RepID=UPI0018CCFDA0|nr:MULTISPECIES: hypothetical protein [unclassified Synechococcus]MEA5422321.1 hypothetical protein [Synechococcus sp. CCY9202]MEA5475334.1 hypothetical protein [Synechococcus sp. CCY9201]QPN58740.1 hypothetical protein H8F24_11230 [Synechococcus sp. CBW1002]QPN65480.1 hypothetical protein H8F26_10890 [Synechococcus sp. CBW1006]
MAPASSSRSPSLPEAPLWVPWLLVGISTMLVVLFVVILGKYREQSRSLRQLRDRVEGLEHSRALERTTILEQQLRSTSERLRKLESLEGSIANLQGQQDRLRVEVRQISRRQVAPELEIPPAVEAPAPSSPAPAPSASSTSRPANPGANP